MGGNYEKSIYNQLMDVMARLDSVEKENRREVSRLNGEIADLKKENQELKEENKRLLDDNARLKSMINNDSSNSSLPPSTDQKGGKPANTYHSRTKSGRKAGGQKGHKGTALTKADVEEKLRKGTWKHEIRTLGGTAGGPYVTKYVIDLEVSPKMTEIRIYAEEDGKFHIPAEYRSDVIYGPDVKALAAALYSEGVMSNDRIAVFLNAASGDELELSEGSIYGFCRKLSEGVQESIRHLEAHMLNQEVVATDATVVSVNGKQAGIRNFSIGDTVLYRAMKSKSLEALEKVEFLIRYTGILVHDHETALYHFGTGHGECNVHLLRYLRKNTEETGNGWSKEMSGLLNRMNREKKSLQKEGKSAFEEGTIAAYEKEYAELIRKGREENRNTRHRYAKKDEKTLLNRLEKYQKNHLLFLHNFSVPFDNNMSERDLRKAKNRQKMAGGFRKESGNEMYCAILTIVETLKRRKMGLIENLKKIFIGTPAIF